MKRLFQTCKGKYPYFLCDGYCGAGISNVINADIPHFYMKSFDGSLELLFQPAHYFKYEIPENPQLHLSPISTFETPSETIISLIERFKATPSLHKIVLAKKRIHTFNKKLPIEELLAKLLHSFPKENVFSYIPDEETMFFGSSPELLYERKGNQIFVDCLAGTVTTVSNQSLFTKKLLEEHRFVTDFVKEAIAPLCTNLSTSEIGTKTAKNLKHLFQTVQGTLLSSTSDAQIINALHPTPAVLGIPKAAAFSFLKEHEPFDREFYAGCIGWLHQDHSRLKVAIRSAIIKNNTFTLFAGAGITRLSGPEDEIQEIDNKFDTLEEVFLEKAVSN